MALHFQRSNSERLTLAIPSGIGSDGLPFSISAWVYPLINSSNQTLVSTHGTTSENARLRLRSNNWVEAITFDGSWNASRNTSGYGTNAWRHIYATFTTTYTEAYLDGDDGSWNGGSCDPLTGIDEITIGAFDTSDHIDAYIAEVGIWEVATAEDDEEKMSQLLHGYSPLFFPENLVAYLPMIRDAQDWMGNSWTANGTISAVDHPTGIIYPSPADLVLPPSAAAATNDGAAWYHYARQMGVYA